MQNLSILQSQIESLKEMIEVMEMTNPDSLAKKWRSKVFEELVRNKQTQIMHSLEIKKLKEEEKRLRSREQQIKTALESAHLQASSLNLERVKLQKEIQNLQLKSRGNTISPSFVLSLQSAFSFNIELHTKTISMLDTFNHRIAFSMSKIKTAKILHMREVLGIRNKLGEEISEEKKLKEEIAKIFEENQRLNNENFELKKELENLSKEFKNAESNANQILMQSNEQFKNYLNELEGQLDAKVNENYVLQNNLERLEKEFSDNLHVLEELREKIEKLNRENEETKKILHEVHVESQNNRKIAEEKEYEVEKMHEIIEDLKEKLEISENKKIEEIGKISEKIDLKNQEIQLLHQEFEKIQRENEDYIEEKQKENEFLLSKISKLESQNKELRRDRDILFENCKKSSQKNTQNKDSQTENQMKQSIVKKTVAPPQSRLKDLEALGKEIFDL